MDIAIHGRLDAGVAEQLLQNLRLHSTFNSLCCIGSISYMGRVIAVLSFGRTCSPNALLMTIFQGFIGSQCPFFPINRILYQPNQFSCAQTCLQN